MAGQEVQSAGCRCTPLLLFVSLILLLSPVSSAQIRQARRILLLEDQTSAPALDLVAREFQSALDSKSRDPIEYYTESLDAMLIPDSDYQAEVRQWYERKYSSRQLDAIVSIGPGSHGFLRAEHQRYFPGVPVVFCLDLEPDPEGALPDPDFAGVRMDFDPVSTVNVARQLIPAAKHVAVVAGAGSIDQVITRVVRRKLQGYQGVDFAYLTDFDMRSLLEKVGSLPEDTVVLYLTVTRDRSGQHFFARETLPLLSNASNVPVFGLVDVLVGRGLVGGHVSNVVGQGYRAAEITSRVLRGEKPESIPVVTSPNQYVFDWKQLQRWGLDASRLPPGSVLLNREPSVWERYQRVIATVVAVILFQSGLVAYLLVQYTKRRRLQRALEHDIGERKKAEASLIDLSSRLINAQEEERSRIARELHDDFNQRLGMLAIDLERAALMIPTDPDKVVQRMHELWNRTGEIGSDLHRLSHNLHSSVLEILGLDEGIRTLCTEFTEQQGVQVEFTSQDVPGTIPSGTSICLFRIVQEGLRNVKKHSGANKAFVRLEGNGEEILLSISDEGVGFDPCEPASNAGLGLLSMRERLRAVGGTIEIQSRRESGTQISVRAPL